MACWENGAAPAGHSNVSATTHKTGSASPLPVTTNTSSSSGGPGLQLAPLRGPDTSRGDRQPDARPDIKDDRERRKEEREPWSMRRHGLGGGAPPTDALGAMNRSDRNRLHVHKLDQVDNHGSRECFGGSSLTGSLGMIEVGCQGRRNVEVLYIM